MARPSPTALSLSPLLATAVAALAVVAVVRWRGARARAEPFGRGRSAALVGSLALLAAVLLSPLETVGSQYLLSAHLLQVLVVMGCVPPLLLLGFPGGGRAWPAPLRLAGDVAVHPAVALLLVNAVFFGWHAPVLFNASLNHPELYAAQMLSLLGVSILFWWPIVEPRGRTRWSIPPLFKLGFLLLATIPQTFAGLIFALDHHLIYQGYAAGILGMTPLSDQQIAGASMALLSKLALFVAFSVLMWRLLDGAEADDEASDDGGGPGTDDDTPTPVPPPLPAWLSLLDTDRVVDEPAPHPRKPERERVAT
ncbi:MAG TPA: cytochrome c oxidase assembly protein [Candidatus Dormibacteraeota bacterium]